MSAIENVLSRLERVRRKHNGWIALCPAHDDKRPSLDVGVSDDGRVLLNCWRGCKTEQVLAELGLGWGDLFDDGHAPTASFAPKRAKRSSESSPPLTRQEIEDDHDAGLSSDSAYLRELIAWNLGLPYPENFTRYEPIASPEFVSKEDADYIGPGGEPRKLRPPLTREDFDSDEVYRSYENWRRKSGSLPPKVAA